MYKVRYYNFDLSAAQEPPKRVDIVGNFIWVLNADSNDSSVNMRINDQANDPIPVRPGFALWNIEFSQLWFDWLAQGPGKFLQIVVIKADASIGIQNPNQRDLNITDVNSYLQASMKAVLSGDLYTIDPSGNPPGTQFYRLYPPTLANETAHQWCLKNPAGSGVAVIPTFLQTVMSRSYNANGDTGSGLFLGNACTLETGVYSQEILNGLGYDETAGANTGYGRSDSRMPAFGNYLQKQSQAQILTYTHAGATFTRWLPHYQKAFVAPDSQYQDVVSASLETWPLILYPGSVLFCRLSVPNDRGPIQYDMYPNPYWYELPYLG